MFLGDITPTKVDNMPINIAYPIIKTPYNKLAKNKRTAYFLIPDIKVEILVLSETTASLNKFTFHFLKTI